MMKILITGAGGLVGSHLARAFTPAHDVRALGHHDLDITSREDVARWCRRERPNLIVNCAVLQVDPCELHPMQASAVNVEGPQNIALAAAEVDAEVLHFSTNYVFDGKVLGRAPYTNTDETHPINVYGRTKLEGEHQVLTRVPRSYIVRTAWVYGSGKESFLAGVPRRLRVGEPVQAIADAFSTTTYVRDLVRRTSEIIELKEFGTYHIVNEGVCSYYDFAVEAARLLGLSEAEAGRLIVKVSESELNRPAVRPRWTPLECVLSAKIGLKPMPRWQEALASYISNDLGEP